MKVTSRYVVIAALAVTVAGCTSGDDASADDDANGDGVTSADGLCEFVPWEHVQNALGLDDLEGDGTLIEFRPLARTADQATSVVRRGTCWVRRSGETDRGGAVRVRVDWNLDERRDDFELGLKNEAAGRFPDEVGLGYAWTRDDRPRPDGSEGLIGGAQLAYGDVIVSAVINLPAEGTDPKESGTAIVLEMVESLNLPDQWTLDDDPPSRLGSSSVD